MARVSRKIRWLSSIKSLKEPKTTLATGTLHYRFRTPVARSPVRAFPALAHQPPISFSVLTFRQSYREQYAEWISQWGHSTGPLVEERCDVHIGQQRAVG